MRSLSAFTKKEWMEQVRSGRLMLLLIIFVLLGVMNPGIAKLTPWLLETMSESMAESGMVVTSTTVDAMTSWTQYFKNVPIGLIAFILLQSNIFTKEYQSGTLVLTLTKGLSRWKVVIAKTTVLALLWSACYWLCFGITYVYNDFYWDNSIAQNLIFSAVCWWLLGLWTLSMLVFFSTIGKSSSTAMLGTGGMFFVVYLFGMLPKVKKHSPLLLMDGNSLTFGTEGPESYYSAIVITIVVTLLALATSIPILNKKRI